MTAEMEKGKPTIFLFINEGKGTDWIVTMAMAEDGTVLAQHVSSTEGWAHHDIGHSSTWKHDVYARHYPDGFRLEWVDSPREHAGLMEAYRINQQHRAERLREALAPRASEAVVEVKAEPERTP